MKVVQACCEMHLLTGRCGGTGPLEQASWGEKTRVGPEWDRQKVTHRGKMDFGMSDEPGTNENHPRRLNQPRPDW